MDAQVTDPVARAPELVALLRAVAEPQRLALLGEMAGGSRSVGELVERTGLAQPSVSHHLAVLQRAGIVDATRSGRQRRYSWAPVPPGSARADLVHWLRRWWVPGRPETGNPVAPPVFPRARPSHLEDHLL